MIIAAGLGTLTAPSLRASHLPHRPAASVYNRQASKGSDWREENPSPRVLTNTKSNARSRRGGQGSPQEIALRGATSEFSSGDAKSNATTLKSLQIDSRSVERMSGEKLFREGRRVIALQPIYSLARCAVGQSIHLIRGLLSLDIDRDFLLNSGGRSCPLLSCSNRFIARIDCHFVTSFLASKTPETPIRFPNRSSSCTLPARQPKPAQ